jgi:hypothetical protein
MITVSLVRRLTAVALARVYCAGSIGGWSWGCGCGCGWGWGFLLGRGFLEVFLAKAPAKDRHQAFLFLAALELVHAEVASLVAGLGKLALAPLSVVDVAVSFGPVGSFAP